MIYFHFEPSNHDQIRRHFDWQAKPKLKVKPTCSRRVIRKWPRPRHGRHPILKLASASKRWSTDHLYFVMLEWLSIILLYHRITNFQHGLKDGSDHRTLEPLDYFFGLFFWTIFFGLFLDHSVWTFYWTNFWTIFLDHFIGGETDHWDAVYQYSGRGGGKLLFIQIIRAVFRKTFFYVKLFALDRSVSLYFWHANAKLAPKHWTMIVIAIKTLLVQSYEAIFSHFWYTVFP